MSSAKVNDLKKEKSLEAFTRKYWRFGIFLIVVGLAGLIWAVNPNLRFYDRDTIFQILLHLSMAIMIAGILIIFVDRILSRFHLIQREFETKKLSEDILSHLFEQFTPPEIRDEVITHIFKSDFYYKKMFLDCIIMEDNVNGDKVLKFTSTIHYEVHNPSNEQKTYELTKEKFLEAEPTPGRPSLEIEELRIKDEDYKDVKVYRKEELEKFLTINAQKSMYTLTLKSIIKPKGFIFVHSCETSNLFIDAGTFTIEVYKPTIGFEASFRFPNRNYKYWILPYISGKDDPSRYLVNYFDTENRILAKIKGAVLPHQCLHLFYRLRNNADQKP